MTPNHSKMQLRKPFWRLFLQQGNIASDIVFTMFSSHFEGARSPVFQEFSSESWCWTPATKKTYGSRLFVFLCQKCAEMGIQREGEKVQKTSLFLLGSALGSPGPLQVTKMEPKDTKILPRDPKLRFWCRKQILKCTISSSIFDRLSPILN